MAEHKRKWIVHVKKFNRQIFDSLDSSGLLLYSQQYGGLTRTQIECIEGPRSSLPHEQVRRFIDLFEDMKYECMKQVIDGLKWSGQKHIALLITNGGSDLAYMVKPISLFSLSVCML